MSTITSPRNPKIKQVRALRQRKHRAATGLFLAEGIRHVGEALDAGVGVEFILYAPDLLTSDFGHGLIQRAKGQGLRCYETNADLFTALAGKEHPQGIIAVLQQGLTPLQKLSPPNFAWGVALVAPQDPGNVGAILRSVDAVGADGVLLLDDSVDPYHPTCVRASMGALFWHPVARASFDDFAQWVGQHGYHVYGTSAQGGTDYNTIRQYRRPAILLLGSEREGLSLEQAALCEELIRLPMRGRVSSLNLAVAAGIMLYAML